MAQWRIIFNGDVVNPATIEKVKERFAHITKLPVERVEHLFSGKPVILKKSDQKAEIDKYAELFEKIGLIITIKAPEFAIDQLSLATDDDTPLSGNTTTAQTSPSLQNDKIELIQEEPKKDPVAPPPKEKRQSKRRKMTEERIEAIVDQGYAHEMVPYKKRNPVIIYGGIFIIIALLAYLYLD